MQERDSFSFGSNSRSLIDQLHARGTTSIQRPVQIVDDEADVVNARPAARKEFPDGGVVGGRLEQLDQALTGRNGLDARPVGIRQLDRLHPEHVAEKRKLRGNGFQRDAHMSDPGAFQGFFLH